MKQTISQIKKVLKNLLVDFEEETNQNTEWKYGDEGSWTDNIKAAREVLGINPRKPKTFKKYKIKFEYKKIKYTHVFTPDSADFWEAFSFGNELFDLNYDEDYNVIAVYPVTKFGDTLTNMLIHKQKINNKKE